MPKIKVALAGDLMHNVNNEISMRSIQDSTMVIEDDGLYAPALPGPDGSGGTGYDDYYKQEGVILGYKTPFQLAVREARKVSNTEYIHRLFDAEFTPTIDESFLLSLTNFRPSQDFVLAGDMFRVYQSETDKWKYYLVTETEAVENGTSHILTYEELGEW